MMLTVDDLDNDVDIANTDNEDVVDNADNDDVVDNNDMLTMTIIKVAKLTMMLTMTIMLTNNVDNYL